MIWLIGGGIPLAIIAAGAVYFMWQDEFLRGILLITLVLSAFFGSLAAFANGVNQVWGS